MVKLKDLELPEEIFENYLIGLHLKCMKHFGYIVAQHQPRKRFHLCKGAVFVASFVVFWVLMFIKISRGFANLADGATTCATAFTYLSTSIAAANALFQRKRVIRMVLFLHEDIAALFRISDATEELMLGKTIKNIRIIMTAMWVPSLVAGVIVGVDCFYCTVFMTETVFNIPEVLNGTAKPILLFQLFPFGEVYDNFVVGYLGPFYALFLGVAVIPCWHTFVTSLMKYIVLKYAVLSKRLRDYDQFAKLSFDLDAGEVEAVAERDSKDCHTKMCEFCVLEQMKLRWFIKQLESLIKIPVFLDFIIFSVLICFLFYAIAAGDTSNMDYLFFAIYMFVMTLILWLYHWHATLITESNEKLGFALYSSSWYTFPVRIQKNVRLMMMESTKPLVMKAIFVELNLTTFIDVVRGAYSYFSILRKAGLKQD